VVRGADPIPAYRLSGGTVVPSVGALPRLWRPVLEPVLAGADELVLDLRSGPYAALAKLRHAIAVTVVDAERRLAISHFNKAYKGRLARVLATVPREPTGIRAVIRTAEKAGLRLEQGADRTLHLVV